LFCHSGVIGAVKEKLGAYFSIRIAFKALLNGLLFIFALNKAIINAI
jgi:hypothetical protein